MDPMLLVLILMETLSCPHGCGWSTSLDTAEGRAAALAAHISRNH